MYALSGSLSSLPPLGLVLSIALAARDLALETWRLNHTAAPPADEFSQPSILPPPQRASEGAQVLPPGPAAVALNELSLRWLDLADWRVWWTFNDDPYLALQGHVRAGTTLSGSDDFFLGSGRVGGGGAPGPMSASARVPLLPPGSPGPNALHHAAEPEPDLEPLPPHASPAERELHVRARVERILRSASPHAGEPPAAMYFRFWGDNPFELASLDPLSTFGVDVDTASYALARQYLKYGSLPEPAQVRTEEFVNYFRADVPAPGRDTFALRTELAPSRFGVDRDPNARERWMLRIALRGREVSRAERQPLALTFVVDTSGSMRTDARLELVKHSLRLLVDQLDARDSIALVSFSNEARIVLPTTSAADRATIESALQGLQPAGGTHAEAGLMLGYELARSSLSPAAVSRVVLLSDGVANVGQTDALRLSAAVRQQREAGIYLNTVGVGLGNYNDHLLEQLANQGDGLCNYVDSGLEAHRALVQNFSGAMEPIARDVKVQVEFDPEQVFRYRLLGYENRAIADESFRDDAVDAGEVGAGHQVVALYELELLRTSAAPLATVRVRWKPPTGAGRDPLEDPAGEFETPVHFQSASSWEGSSIGYQRSVVVAQFAELLRRSSHARHDSLEELIAEAERLERHADDPDFSEFVAMTQRSLALYRAAQREPKPLDQCIEELRRQHFSKAQCDAARIELDPAAELELERRSRELHAEIEELVRRSLAEGHR